MAETEDLAPGASTPPTRRSAAANGTTRSRRSTSASESSTDMEMQEETLEAEVAQLKSDLKSITNTLARMGQTASSELKSTAAARADELAARGKSAVDYAQDEFGALEKQIKDTIREKPLTAVAGAVALGFVLAVLTR